MNQRIPEPIQPILENYLSLANEQLDNLMTAFYVVGSIALDGFNERFSDIDFVAVLNHRATPIEVEHLRNIHKIIETTHPRWKMSGSYLRSGDLGHFDHEVEPHPYCHDGVLQPSGYFQLNSVTWWILKNHGIAVLGPEPHELSFTVDWDLLILRMRENLNSYWVNWTRRPDRIIVMLSDWGIQWAILGVLRLFYSFRESAITTKEKAGAYALACVPIRWHRLIREAISLREGRKLSGYRSRILRAIEAVNFLEYIIQTCNTASAFHLNAEPSGMQPPRSARGRGRPL